MKSCPKFCWSLRWSPKGDDLEIVLCAVSRHGSALRCASPRLRAMEKVVRQAVREDEMAMCWASQEITRKHGRNHGSTAQNQCFFVCCVVQDWCGALGKEVCCMIISDFASWPDTVSLKMSEPIFHLLFWSLWCFGCTWMITSSNCQIIQIMIAFQNLRIGRWPIHTSFKGVANKPPAAKVCSALWSIGTFAVERKHGRVCAGGRLQVGIWAVMVPACSGCSCWSLLRILFGEHGLSLRTDISIRLHEQASITIGGTQWRPEPNVHPCPNPKTKAWNRGKEIV